MKNIKVAFFGGKKAEPEFVAFKIKTTYSAKRARWVTTVTNEGTGEIILTFEWGGLTEAYEGHDIIRSTLEAVSRHIEETLEGTVP